MTELSEIKHQLHSKGFVVVKGLLSKGEIDDIKQEFGKCWIDKCRKGEINVKQAGSLVELFPTLTNIHRSYPQLITFMTNAKLMRVLEAIAEEPVLAFLLNYYFNPPGKKGIPMHQDNEDACASPGTTYAAWVSIDDADRENGGLYFVEGTQNEPINRSFPHDRTPEPGHVVDITTSSGDVVFFGGNIFHASYDNTSINRFRQTFLVHYVPESVERIAINHNALLDRNGRIQRRRFQPTI